MNYLTAHSIHQPSTNQNEFPQEEQKNTENAGKELSVSQIFGLTRERGLKAVAQQLQIWENEMKSVRSWKGCRI